MEQELYNDGAWRLVRQTAALPDGRTKTAVRGYRSDTVHVLAFQHDKVLLLREYRPFDADWVWMLPSGHVDKETDPLEAAKRELREETGFRAGKITHFCSAKHSETFASVNHFYIANDLTHDPLPQDADEMIEVHELTLEEALDKVLSCGDNVRIPSAFLLMRYMREQGC
jgi:ADP-ribose pyrophosphatase